MDYMIIFGMIVIGMVVIGVTVWILYLILRSPFEYPYYIYDFDVSGKRKPRIENLLDNYLIDGNIYKIEEHNKKIQRWKEDCQKCIEHSLLKNLRMKQYEKCLDDAHTYTFRLIRQQTRYKQQDYIKSSYKVDVINKEFSFDYGFIWERYNKLREINFECSLQEYHSKNQRNLMTKELRRTIMAMDNYTCRICGKYMPDEVGLHIDHIMPVSKGGKTVISNLRVLCSKCNGHKSAKYNEN